LLVSLLYLVVCRLFALLVLLARGDRSKEFEILVLRNHAGVKAKGAPGIEPRTRHR